MGRSMPPKPFSYLPDPRLNWEEKLLLQLEVAGQIRTKKEKHSLKTKAHAIHLCFFHANLHHHTDRWSRKSSCCALCFLLWGCAVLCLPKPPPHHTPKLTATKVAGAVRGAWKHTGVVVSHDPKGAEQQTFVSSEGINQAFLSSEDINQALFRDVGYGGRCL
ncbi:hypothetical protein CMV_021905 [Castanea mollissima]|uniref:Uncharacterized protein n=1 Tax=Castanea mollissima TaxID=60419 RepID=A0A8J4QIY3_9ROSI|nr:hypothetical protein CMV_021905 [Castanea mollissima]